MATLFKTYFVTLLLLFGAVIGAFFGLAGGEFGMPATMDWMQFGIVLGVLHGMVALFGLMVGGRKKAGRFVCMIVGLLFGVLGAFIVLMFGNKKPEMATAAAGGSAARRAGRR